MVKIVDMIPDPSVVKQKVCYNCGVKLEYTPNDIRKRKSKDYTGIVDIDKVIDCPNCNMEVRV